MNHSNEAQDEKLAHIPAWIIHGLKRAVEKAQSENKNSQLCERADSNVDSPSEKLLPAWVFKKLQNIIEKTRENAGTEPTQDNNSGEAAELPEWIVDRLRSACASAKEKDDAPNNIEQPEVPKWIVKRLLRAAHKDQGSSTIEVGEPNPSTKSLSFDPDASDLSKVPPWMIERLKSAVEVAKANRSGSQVLGEDGATPTEMPIPDWVFKRLKVIIDNSRASKAEDMSDTQDKESDAQSALPKWILDKLQSLIQESRAAISDPISDPTTEPEQLNIPPWIIRRLLSAAKHPEKEADVRELKTTAN
eukprot:Filipodium_phascolosomae@DN4546_c0_g1_i1.p1